MQHSQAGLWLIASDAQIPHHSPEALEVFFAAVKALKPVGVVLAGDWIDGRTISSHVKNPNDTRTLQDEIDIATQHMARLASVPTRVWLGSNHCGARLARYLATKAPELACLPGLTIPKLLGLDNAGWLFKPYGEPFELGDALCLHGHKVSQQNGQSALKHIQQYTVASSIAMSTEPLASSSARMAGSCKAWNSGPCAASILSISWASPTGLMLLPWPS
jgi:hypothetical protein